MDEDLDSIAIPNSEVSDWSEDVLFLRRLLSAVLRVAAGCVMAGADWCFNWTLRTVLGHAPANFITFLEAIGFVAFAILYVYLLWDMLCVFMPKLKVNRK